MIDVEAVIGLLGAIVGGVLVVIGDVLARRSERRAYRVEQLRLAAADVIATYLRARSHLIARKGDDRPLSLDEVWPNDRQLALARLFTLPGSERLRASIGVVSEATVSLFDARDDPDIEVYFERQLSAIRDLENEVRKLLA
jgi:hypothetical protein